MLELYFLIRHTPFWAVPIMVLSGEFGYMFWLRKKKKQAYYALLLFSVAFCFVIFYAWAGGPEKSVQIIKKFYLEQRTL